MSDDERWVRGAAEFTAVTGMPAPRRGDDYVADVVIDQVFAEIWTRPGLTRKERRWIAITCACWAGVPFAIVSGGLLCVAGAVAFAVLVPGFARHLRPDAVPAA